MEYQIKAPVLLIGFNRPDVIEQSFNYIKAAKPKKLFVAIDGARVDVDGEDQLVEKVKTIVRNVDWECETHYKFNDKNLGAEITVSSAVTWALEREESVIVLEDDIIAPMAFLRFADEMLTKYVDNERVFMISGGQFTPFKIENDEDYLFGYWGHTGCGWATWKRAWSKFNLKIDIPDDIEATYNQTTLVLSTFSKKYFSNRMKNMKNRGVGNSSWDACWNHIRFMEDGLSIIPRDNLTSNIGTYGLHAQGKTKHHFRRFDENFVVKKHPACVQQNVGYDQYHFKKYINYSPSILQRIIRKALSYFKGSFIGLLNFVKICSRR